MNFVSDKGDGIEIKYSNKLFLPFQWLHGKEFKGTGIGLASVSKIIQHHGGRIWAESKLGQRAIFYFYLDREGRYPRFSARR